MKWLLRAVAAGVVASCGGSGDDMDASTDASIDQTTQDVSQQDVAQDTTQDSIAADTGADVAQDVTVDAPSDAASDVVDASVPDVDGGCMSNSDCTSSFCAKPEGDCNGYGLCAVKPLNCPVMGPGVCGCDKTTYANVCRANSAGVNIAYDGGCE